MRKITLEIFVATALTLVAVITSAQFVWAGNVLIGDGFARASATPMAKSGAAYVTITNQGDEADRLVAVSSPAAAMAEPHRTTMTDGVMRMEAVEAIDLPASGTIEMAPGGLHIMLMGLKAPLKQGESLELVLTFEKAGAMTVTIPIGPVAAGDHSSGN